MAMREESIIENLFTDKLNLSEWELYSVKENYVYEEVSIPGLRQEAYRRTFDAYVISVGVFYYHDVLVYIAWGLKAAHHCSMHAPLTPDGKILETRISCPEVVPLRTNGLVTGFTLDGKNTFGSGSRNVVL